MSAPTWKARHGDMLPPVPREGRFNGPMPTVWRGFPLSAYPKFYPGQCPVKVGDTLSVHFASTILPKGASCTRVTTFPDGSTLNEAWTQDTDPHEGLGADYLYTVEIVADE